ncbi:uncharacterized protein BYT42DRAFT_604986 [Radiomyces spectabilis]|uniref:uncharacterized protein n=1 Tax=Radiomyces spectabilis TaxID=64574 RepID=UPI00221F3083|nr:uncharacterized protein BYT42DRAFT_604986 [Radiomyces spectabilis]KAI8379673.1 hypothetical protein BYT42DRAFT_604986 [Radiomyces spectabilis]
MDLFQDNFIQATIDPKIILQLPLLDIILKPPQPHTAPVASVIAAASRQCILVSDVLSFDPTNNCLRRKHHNKLPRCRRAITQLVKLLNSWQILFRPFVISACAPAPTTSDEALVASTTADAQCLFSWRSFGPLNLILVRPRTLRRQILAANHPHEPPATTLTLWARFWSISLTSVTRNLWCRILHSKLPSRTFLHRLLPAVHITDECAICTISTDTPIHFLYQCPLKRVVWESIWPDLLLLPVNETQILKALYQLNFPRDPPDSWG